MRMDKGVALICITFLMGLALIGAGWLLTQWAFTPEGGGGYRWITYSPAAILIYIGQFLMFGSLVAAAFRYFKKEENESED
jgi:ABC-type transporter Mla subunit MlaD